MFGINTVSPVFCDEASVIKECSSSSRERNAPRTRTSLSSQFLNLLVAQVAQLPVERSIWLLEAFAESCVSAGTLCPAHSPGSSAPALPSVQGPNHCELPLGGEFSS